MKRFLKHVWRQRRVEAICWTVGPLLGMTGHMLIGLCVTIYGWIYYFGRE